MEFRIFEMFLPRAMEFERARGVVPEDCIKSLGGAGGGLATRGRGVTDGDFDRGFSALPLATD